MRRNAGSIASLFYSKHLQNIMAAQFSGHLRRFKKPGIVKHTRMLSRRPYSFKNARRLYVRKLRRQRNCSYKSRRSKRQLLQRKLGYRRLRLRQLNKRRIE